MKVIYRFGSLLLTVLLLMGCGHKDKAVGPSDMVFVLSNPTTREALGDAIDTTFSYGLRTPQFEPYFTTNWKPIQKFNSFIRMKNVLVIADLNGPGVGTDIARLVLSEEQYALAEQDSAYLFFVEDYWAEEQSFVLIAGRDYERMRRNVLEQQGWLYEKFNRRFLEDQLGYIYAHNEQKKLAQKIWDHYH